MPDLNRRIRITIEAEGENVDGTFVPGPVETDETVWCQRRDLGSSEDLSDIGFITTSFVIFIVRYWGALVSTRDSRITLYEILPDGSEREYYVRRVRELDDRRRYLEVEGGHVS